MTPWRAMTAVAPGVISPGPMHARPGEDEVWHGYTQTFLWAVIAHWNVIELAPPNGQTAAHAHLATQLKGTTTAWPAAGPRSQAAPWEGRHIRSGSSALHLLSFLVLLAPLLRAAGEGLARCVGGAKNVCPTVGAHTCDVRIVAVLHAFPEMRCRAAQQANMYRTDLCCCPAGCSQAPPPSAACTLASRVPAPRSHVLYHPAGRAAGDGCVGGHQADLATPPPGRAGGGRPSSTGGQPMKEGALCLLYACDVRGHQRG